MKYTPLNDYVIVKKVAGATTTASGIILQSTNSADNAVVIAMHVSVNPLIAVGDTIMLRWSNALKIDGEVYAVSYKEIVCKLNDQTA
jgi:co-chaperonin GroES (HSP10)